MEGHVDEGNDTRMHIKRHYKMLRACSILGTLLYSLACLLESLDIPIELESVLDLTPLLILAIFESILRMRLPISAETRRAATRSARVEIMKIFLGVLEDDIIGFNIGLAEIDPRRLADGKKDEVFYVAKVLCWLGKKMGYISEDGLSVGNVALSKEQHLQPPMSPSLRSSLSVDHRSSLSMLSSPAESQTTTTLEAYNIGQEGYQNENDASRLSYHHAENFTDSSERLTPDLVSLEETPHQEDRDELDDSLYCDCPPGTSRLAPPIRTTGFLEVQDLEAELREYENRRAQSSRLRARARTSDQNSTPSFVSRIDIVSTTLFNKPFTSECAHIGFRQQHKTATSNH